MHRARRQVVASGSWRWLQGIGLERFELHREHEGWRLRGTILASGDGLPAEARYEVRCDEAWRTTQLAVQLRRGGRTRVLRLNVTNGRWLRGETEQAAVRGCVDVDLSWSPSTNTLPIRRLALGIGASSGPVTAAWIRLPGLTLEPLPQEYRRLGERRYLYSSRGGSFTAELDVDEHGLVLDYAGAWRRVEEGDRERTEGGNRDRPRLLEVRHVSVSIDRPAEAVYAFAVEAENLPRWAAGLGKTIRKVDGDWIAEGPAGRVKVRFAERNSLGVLDHDVVLESGATVHNPFRVVPNATGSEVTFTLFRQPGVSAAGFADDAKAVERDLRTLKALLEGRKAGVV